MTKFWLDNPCVLLTTFNLNPFNNSLKHAEKYNALTRLTIILFIIVFILNPTTPIIYAALVSILFIIFMYRYTMSEKFKNDINENYNNLDNQPKPEPESQPLSGDNEKIVEKITNPDYAMEKEYESINCYTGVRVTQNPGQDYLKSAQKYLDYSNHADPFHQDRTCKSNLGF